VNNPVDLKQAENQVYRVVKAKLEDSKTNWFITIMVINVFLWGMMISAYRSLERDYENLFDAHGVTQVSINQLKGKINE